MLGGEEIKHPTSKSVGGGDEKTLQTSAMMMNQIVEVGPSLLLQTLLHLLAAALAMARRWKKKKGKKDASRYYCATSPTLGNAPPPTKAKSNWNTKRRGRRRGGLELNVKLHKLDRGVKAR